MDEQIVPEKSENEETERVTEKSTLKEETKKKSKRSKLKHRKKHREEEKGWKPNFDIPGVVKLIISSVTQSRVGLMVGEDVTSENPWRYLPKEAIDDDLELHEETSEFLSIKPELLEYQTQQILVGYIPDEEREYDEFYICLTQSATEAVEEIIEKIREEREERLKNTVEKYTKVWKTLGSEEEVDNEIIKNNRPLYEVEIETKYPIMASKVQFKIRTVQAARDGYVELLQGRFTFNNINKRRVDASVQVSLPAVCREAQTICTYPKNMWTQYQYDYIVDEKPSAEFKESIKKFISDNMNNFYDNLTVNWYINLYTNDYNKLVLNELYTKPPAEIAVREYMSFTDIKLCKDMMISSVCWHPMLTGVVAIAYCDTSLNNYLKEYNTVDESTRVTFCPNTTLIWSFVDGLKPKLILQAHREITSLSFCPYDESLIVGGCKNGQIILWDIRNKLQKVEEEEILTPTQQKYRTIMFSLMGWMKNIKNIALVPITAVTDLEYSHYSSVTKIEWLSPFFELTKLGQVAEVPEETDTLSMQFVTSSVDGTILFWDLKSKPTTHAGDYKPQRRLRRLKKRPSALTLDVSPYRILNRVFKPLYRINVTNNKKQLYAVSSFAIPYCQFEYEETDPNPNRKYNILNRIKYKPIINKSSQEKFEKKINVSTTFGDVIIGSWDGFDYHSGGIVSEEDIKTVFEAKYHDGPVTSLERWPVSPDIILSVGGKIFAIWKDDFKDRPILWRRSRQKYTHGSWNTFDPTMIRLTKSDGIIEMWSFVLKSNEFVLQQSISGQILTGSFTQQINNKVLGVADYNGYFRMFHSSAGNNRQDLNIKLKDWFSRQIIILEHFKKWQNEWNDKHATWIKQQQEEAILMQKLKAEAEETERLRLAEEEERMLKKAAKEASMKNRPPPGKYSEWCEKQWVEREQERMNSVLLHLKQLNPELLRTQQAPLKQIEKEEVVKRDKQMARQAEAGKIFEESVAMYFPHVLQKKPPPPLDPYAGGDSFEKKMTTLGEYEISFPLHKQFIDTNPFTFNFDWQEILRNGRMRRQIFDVSSECLLHKTRHERRKTERRSMGSLNVTVEVKSKEAQLDEDDLQASDTALSQIQLDEPFEKPEETGTTNE